MVQQRGSETSREITFPNGIWERAKKLGQAAHKDQTGNSMANKNLTSAKRAKNDEFYTQYADIQKEIEAYLEYNPDVFRGKVVYCNCDDPYESNFFRYFVLNFKKLGLKRLITTSYKPSPIANTQLELFGGEEYPAKRKGRSKVTANKFINSIARFTGEVMFCPMCTNASIITGIVPHNCRGVFTMGESHARIGYRRRRIYWL